MPKIDYKSISRNIEKLAAVESLIQQVIDEHNRIGADARANWIEHSPRWNHFTKTDGLFSYLFQPLLTERSILKKLVTQEYCSANGKNLNSLPKLEKYSLSETLFEDKVNDRKKSTIATYSGLNTLQSLKIDKLPKEFPVDPLQNWTAPNYTEVDTSGVVTVEANILHITNLTRPMDACVYKDFGVGHFGLTLINNHLISTEASAVGSESEFAIWGLANITNPRILITDPRLEVHWTNGPRIYMTLDDGATLVTDLTGGGVVFYATQYWLSIGRGVAGCSCAIYSNAARTVLVDTLAFVDVGASSFRYLSHCWTRGGAGVNVSSGHIYNSDIQENSGAFAGNANLISKMMIG